MQEATHKPGEYVLKEGEQTEAAFYIINKGQLELTSAGGRKETLIVYSHFGDEMMLLDAETGKNDYSDPTTVNAPYTVQVCGDGDCTVGILKLEDCRRVFDTTYLGKTREAIRDSIVDRKFSLQELDKHRIIGCGRSLIYCEHHVSCMIKVAARQRLIHLCLLCNCLRYIRSSVGCISRDSRWPATHVCPQSSVQIRALQEWSGYGNRQ